MKYLKILIIILFLLFSVNVSAEFYKYVDEDGNVRFTDDINMVPEAQRSNIRSYVESVSEEAPEQEAALKNQGASEEQSNFPDLSEDEPEENLEDTRKRIDKMKAEIDQEYKALQEEKKRLDKERAEAKTNEQIEKYNNTVESYKKRTDAFIKKQEETNALIETYNERIYKQQSQKQTE